MTTILDKNLAAEVAYRNKLGMTQVTLKQLEAKLKELGYRLDRSMDCKGNSRYMTGERAGESYPACGLRPVQIDDGLGFCHVDARRDDKFKALQAMRNTHYVVANGYILEI